MRMTKDVLTMITKEVIMMMTKNVLIMMNQMFMGAFRKRVNYWADSVRFLKFSLINCRFFLSFLSTYDHLILAPLPPKSSSLVLQNIGVAFINKNLNAKNF